MDVDLPRLFTRAAVESARHRATVAGRPVHPAPDRASLEAALGGPLPAQPTDPGQVLEELIAAASPGLVGTVGPRFFGFVIGGCIAAATAADMLAAGWDQCAYNEVLSPAAAAVERVAGRWPNSCWACLRRPRSASSPVRRRPTPSASPSHATSPR